MNGDEWEQIASIVDFKRFLNIRCLRIIKDQYNVEEEGETVWSLMCIICDVNYPYNSDYLGFLVSMIGSIS